MKKVLSIAAVIALGASITPAATPQSGKVTSMTSVSCGTKKQGKKESTDLMCQQYTVRTNTSEYQVRQQKPSNSQIIPADTPITYTIDKDKMKLKVNGKTYTFLIVGNTALGAGTN